MKKYRSRKEKVFRRSLLIVALALLLSLTNAMNFLPWQAVEDMTETQNISEPKVIRSFYNNKLKVYRFARQYFVEGKEGLMLCAVGYSLLMGWYDRDWCAVPTYGETPLYMGYRGHSQGGAYTGYVFGRVEDAELARIVLRWRPGTGIEDDFRYWELPQEAFFRENGTRYILWETEDVGQSGWEYRVIDDLTAFAYDENGKLLYESEVHWQDWGSGG